MAKEEQIKTSIDLTGEKEYRAACNSINSSLREINSEMKLATAEFADNASGAEALTKKQEILQKQLAEQAKKAEAAEEALKKMREAGIDPTDPAYQKMQTNLNNTKAEMAKTEKQIKSTSEELKSSKVNWEAVGETVGKVGKAFGAALAALGAAAVGAASALAGLTVSASNYADDLITQATFTRQTTDDLQKYAYAARFIDVEVNTLTKSMAKNIKSMDSARKGSAAYADAYKKLGVSVTDANGELRNSNDVYWDCIDALGSIQNETERDALAMQLFGKSAQELNSVIEAGSEAFKELGDEAEQKLGIKYYGRYMDDFFLIHHDKAYLQECRKQIEAFVQARGLSLNAKTNIFPLKHGVDFLGFHTYLTESGAVIRKVRRRSKNNMKRKLKKLAALHAAGRIDAKTVEQSYQSWRGHAEKGNSYHLIRRTDQYYNSLMKPKEAAQCQKH